MEKQKSNTPPSEVSNTSENKNWPRIHVDRANKILAYYVTIASIGQNPRHQLDASTPRLDHQKPDSCLSNHASALWSSKRHHQNPHKANCTIRCWAGMCNSNARNLLAQQLEKRSTRCTLLFTSAVRYQAVVAAEYNALPTTHHR